MMVTQLEYCQLLCHMERELWGSQPKVGGGGEGEGHVSLLVIAYWPKLLTWFQLVIRHPRSTVLLWAWKEGQLEIFGE